MATQSSALADLQRIARRATEELCQHTDRLQRCLDIRKDRTIALEKTLRAIEMQVTALATRRDATSADAFELLATIKTAALSVLAKHEDPIARSGQS